MQQKNHHPAARAWPNRIPALALLAANLVLVALALKDQWGFLQVLYVCWCEAMIVGAYNLLKMIVVILFGSPFGGTFRNISFENRMALGFVSLLGIGFFIVKFAGFALATGFLLMLLPSWLGQLETGHPRHSFTFDGFEQATEGLPIILLGLVISHGVSFIFNFLGRREYQRTNIVVLLFWPYARMALVIVVLSIAGVIAALAPPLGRTTVFALGVVCLKIAADLASHAIEHARKPARPPPLPVSRVQVAGSAA